MTDDDAQGLLSWVFETDDYVPDQKTFYELVQEYYDRPCSDHPGDYGVGCEACERDKIRAREEIASSKGDK